MDNIKNLQKILKDSNYYTGNIDGIWGDKSQQSLEVALSKGTFKLDFNFERFKKLFEIKTLSQEFVDNINCIFNSVNKHINLGATNPTLVSYLLATAWHETAFTMKPVKEYGSYKYLSKYDTGALAKALGNTPQADGDGVLYAGRGYVQITGRANYKKFSGILGIDLITNPDYTLNPEIAADILVYGSLKGSFTGKKLSDYIKRGTRDEYIQARRVINGTDKASSIAGHALKFLQCISLTA